MIRLRNILSEVLAEYSEEEKQKMGIPSGAVARGGHWYQGDKYVGKVVNGKFQAAASGDTGDAKPSAGKPTTPTSPAADKAPASQPSAAGKAPRTVSDKELDDIHDKFEESGLARSAEGMRIPMADFTKQTGISPEEAHAYTKQQTADPLFHAVPETGEVVVAPEAYRFLDAGRAKNSPSSGPYLYKDRGGITAGDYVVDKVEDKFEESGLWAREGESIPADEFEKKTGISRDAMKAYAKYVRGVPAFHYDEETDDVTMDPRRDLRPR